MKKLLSVILTVVLIACALSACSDEKTDKNAGKTSQSSKQEANNKDKKKENEDKKEKKEKKDVKLPEYGDVVAKIGDFDVTLEYYNFTYKSLYSQAEAEFKERGDNWIDLDVGNGKTVREYIKESTLSQIKMVIAANVLAKDYGIDPGSDDIKKAALKEKDKALESFENDEDFKKFLDDCRSTEEAVDQYFIQFEVYNRVMEKLTSENDKSAREEALKEFNEQFVKAQYIFIYYGEIPQEDNKFLAKSEDEAKFVANTVIERLDAGEDFVKLMGVYNEDEAMNSEEKFLFAEDNSQQEVYNAAKKLGFNEYSKTPVKSSQGYYVIKRYKIDENDEDFKEYNSGKVSYNAGEKIEAKVKELKTSVENDVIDVYTDNWIKEMKQNDKK